ncbi:MAG: iron-sulfur cluster assembly scaffold protein [Xanthobacteraceae bacterium]
MTATCREACCSAPPRLTVAELFERGFRRNRLAPLPIEGARCNGADDNDAQFSIEVADGKLAAIGFRASCCATLIAYCEFIAEIAPGFRLEIARGLTAANLVEGLPGVPALKRDRAVLAITAFRAALAEATNYSNQSGPDLARTSRLGAHSPS